MKKLCSTMRKLISLLVLAFACRLIEAGRFGSLLNCFRGQQVSEDGTSSMLTGGELLDDILRSRNKNNSMRYDDIFSELRDELNGSSDEILKETIATFLELEQFYKKNSLDPCSPEVAQALLNNKPLFPEPLPKDKTKRKKKSDDEGGELEKVNRPISKYIYQRIENNFISGCEVRYVRPYGYLDQGGTPLDQLMRHILIENVIHGILLKDRSIRRRGSRLPPEFLGVLGPQKITQSDVDYLLEYVRRLALISQDFETLSSFDSSPMTIQSNSEKLCQVLKLRYFDACQYFEDRFASVFDTFDPIADRIGKLDLAFERLFCISYAKYKMCKILRQDEIDICDKVKNHIQSSATE